jgi:hypothetical protein
MAYVEGMAVSTLTFDDSGELVRRLQRPPVEVAFAYSPENGLSSSELFSMDHKLMQAAWHGGLREGRSPVQHSPDFGSISVHEVVFTFRSDCHRNLVRQLYEAWRDGSGPLVTGRVLKEAGYTSTQLSHAFSNTTGQLATPHRLSGGTVLAQGR